MRLLLNNPTGAMYTDFTVVSAAGVVTDGANGRELEAAFDRLYKARGVRVVRADTATAREFTFNAARIEEAARSVTTSTWGWLGYSQGCANALTAESMMRGGTPEQQVLLKGLRSRHLLFGAHNGSSHADCGGPKVDLALVHAEESGKLWQARVSKQAYLLAMDAINDTLNR